MEPAHLQAVDLIEDLVGSDDVFRDLATIAEATRPALDAALRRLPPLGVHEAFAPHSLPYALQRISSTLDDLGPVLDTGPGLRDVIGSTLTGVGAAEFADVVAVELGGADDHGPAPGPRAVVAVTPGAEAAIGRTTPPADPGDVVRCSIHCRRVTLDVLPMVLHEVGHVVQELGRLTRGWDRLRPGSDRAETGAQIFELLPGQPGWLAEVIGLGSAPAGTAVELLTVRRVLVFRHRLLQAMNDWLLVRGRAELLDPAVRDGATAVLGRSLLFPDAPLGDLAMRGDSVQRSFRWAPREDETTWPANPGIVFVRSTLIAGEVDRQEAGRYFSPGLLARVGAALGAPEGNGHWLDGLLPTTSGTYSPTSVGRSWEEALG